MNKVGILRVVDALHIAMWIDHGKKFNGVTGSVSFKNEHKLPFKMEVLLSYHTETELYLTLRVAGNLFLMVMFDGSTMVTLVLDAQGQPFIPPYEVNDHHPIGAVVDEYKDMAVAAFMLDNHKFVWEPVRVEDVTCW